MKILEKEQVLSKFTKRRILVTGSSGYIGQKACKDLINFGAQVLGVDKDAIKSKTDQEEFSLTSTSKINKIIREFTKIYKVKNNDITYKNIHRWRYAKVKNYFPLEQSKISKKMPLGIAGDWCPPMLDGYYYANSQRVEDAFLSGIECSKALVNKFFK